MWEIALGVVLGLFAFSLIAASIKKVMEYERAVLFRLGRLVGVRGPGIFFILPGFDSLRRVDLRTVTSDIPPQEVITKDNVTVKVNAVLYYRVVDPEKAITQVENYHYATGQMALTTLRSVVGQAELDELLSQRDKLNREIQRIVDEATDPWGIKVSAVEIKDVILPAEMQRAMAAQAEGERTKRARVIVAEGELIAAQKIAEAAQTLRDQPGALFLRLLQTLTEISQERTNTLIIPFPVEMLEALGLRRAGSSD